MIQPPKYVDGEWISLPVVKSKRYTIINVACDSVLDKYIQDHDEYDSEAEAMDENLGSLVRGWETY
jgi:hypothetical protein